MCQVRFLQFKRIRAFPFVLAGFMTILFFSLLRAVPLLAAPPELQLEITPDSVEVAPDSESLVIAVLRNPSDQTLTNVQLSTFTNTAVEVGVSPSEPVDLPPNAAVVWELRVRQGAQGPDAGKIYVRVDYRWQESGAGSTDSVEAPRVLVGSFDVTIPQAPAAADAAGAEIRSTLTSLNDQRKGTIFLLLENKKDVPLTVVTIAPQTPDFVTIAPEDGNPGGLVLEPRATLSIPYVISATEMVEPGKSLILFDVDLAWQEEGRAQTGTLIATHELEVGVFGESAILTLLGIPAFFLLPGFLLLIVLKILLSVRQRGAAQPTTPSFLDIKNKPAEFAAIAITVSLVAALIYPPVTRWLLGVPRNYLRAYGLNDIFYLWFGAIAAAMLLFVGYFVLMAGYRAAVRWQQQRQARKLAARTPVPGDDEKTTIQKLGLRGGNLQLEKVQVTVEGQSYWGYVLVGDRTTDRLWVVPMICVMNRANLDSAVQDRVYAAQTADQLDDFLMLLPQLSLAWRREVDGSVVWPPGVSIPYEAPQVDVEFAGEREEFVGFC